MNASQRREAVKRMFLALWAMATCVLVFVIGLLVYTMLEQGENPMALANRLRPLEPPEHHEEPVQRSRTKAVKLYFSAPDGGHLVGETRSIAFGESTVENCRAVLKALREGPSAKDDYLPIIPSGMKVRALYALANGALVIDFTQPPPGQETAMSSVASEALMVYGIVNTLAQPAIQGTDGGAVKTVRFLFQGYPPPKTFPAHVDLSEPVAPDPTWNAPAFESAPRSDSPTQGGAHGESK